MNRISDLLTAAITQRPDATALRWRDAVVTYGGLDIAIDDAVAQLGAAGLAPGDRVAIVGPNVPGTVVWMCAAWRAGAVVVPVNDRLRADDLRAAFTATDPHHVVAVARPDGARTTTLVLDAAGERPGTRSVLAVDPLGGTGPQVHGPGPGCGADGRDDPEGRDDAMASDIGLVMTTSGTSGTPKAVLVRHRRELESAADLADVLAIAASDRTVLAVSVTHAFGLTCLLAALSRASTTVLVDATTSVAPLVDALADATLVHGSPTLFSSLVPSLAPAVSPGSAPERRAGLRAGFVAGAPCPAELIERFDAVGVRLANLYGMTELGATCASAPDAPLAVRADTCGRALRGHELRVRDGVLEVTGAHVTPGYFRDPQRTAAAFTDDGWFRTHDLAEIDDAGTVRVTGRADDIVAVGGFNVSPAEVERCLLGHPQVEAVVVVSIPDARLGHALAAFAVPRPGSAVVPRDLVAHVRARLAGYKVPYRVEFMDQLPTLTGGKPDRRALQERADPGRESFQEPGSPGPGSARRAGA